jgi:hypothetical protein
VEADCVLLAARVVAAYLAGATMDECAAMEGVSRRTIGRLLDAEGVARRHPQPRPDERVCARDGCDNCFRPTRRQLDQGYGLYCSNTCDGEAHRIYARPAERTCARDGCEVRFTPQSDKGWHEARGRNRYCSRRCYGVARSQAGKRAKAKKGRWLRCDNKTCPRGGREFFRYDCELERDRGPGTQKEGTFCSTACHAEHRRRYPWPGYRTFINPSASGGARQKMIGAREGRAAGRRGGKKRGYSAAKATEVLELRRKNPRLGRNSLAKRTGLTEKQVRNILAEAA